MDRRQNNGSVKAVSLRNCCFNCRAWAESHKDNVRCTAVEEQLEAKEVQLSQPSSTSLLMMSSPSSRSLDLLISPGTLSKSARLNGFTFIPRSIFGSLGASKNPVTVYILSSSIGSKRS